MALGVWNGKENATRLCYLICELSCMSNLLPSDAPPGDEDDENATTAQTEAMEHSGHS